MNVTPQSIIDAHMDLLRRAETDPDFRHYVVRDLVPKAAEAATEQVLLNAVRQAFAYRVSEDLGTLLSFAASQLDESDVWDSSLAPTAAGLVRFTVPLTIIDALGAQQKAHWMLWGPHPDGGTYMHLWCDLRDPDQAGRNLLRKFHPDSLRTLGNWSSLASPPRTREGESLGPMTLTSMAAYDLAITTELATKNDALQADFDRTFGSSGVPWHTKAGRATNVARLLHAFWLMLAQPIAETERPHIRKSAAKVAERAGVGSTVTVVRLRRENGSDRKTGESSMEWSRRWVVRGHWRWQAYGTGRELRRRLWIAPYVKGPEGAPLVVTDKVYDVKP